MSGGNGLSQSAGDDNNIVRPAGVGTPYSDGTLIRLRSNRFNPQSNIVPEILDPEVIATIENNANAFEKHIAIVVAIEDEETGLPKADEVSVRKEG